jgi:MerR family transcriptional regulator, redox-sensitive transcriptional activator SoxR
LGDAILTIGEAAELAGIRTSAIRYYERVGLIPHPERVSGQRRYEEGVVRRLELIAVAKEAGFTLGEVRTLLDSADRGDPAHRQLRALAERKLPEVDALIERAQAVREWLTTASDCNCKSLEDCRLFVKLKGGFENPDAVELKVIQQGPDPASPRP